MKLIEEIEQRQTDKLVEMVRHIMGRPNACAVLTPTDLQALVGEIDRLRNLVKQM